MFTGLKRGLKKGETVSGTLIFEHQADAAGHAGHAMPGGEGVEPRFSTIALANEAGGAIPLGRPAADPAIPRPAS